MNTLDSLLTQLEEWSARALECAAADDLSGTCACVRERESAIAQLQATLAEAGPVTYAEWNRLAVIHFQGNRIAENLRNKRMNLGRELLQSVREQALLGCVTGVVNETMPASTRLNESA